jgi:hypothetical protein
MQKYLLGLLMLLLTSVGYAADVGVSVSVGQPGFYGQLDIGDFPRPQLIYAQPRVVQIVQYDVRPAPLYLRVPPGHYNHWDRYCSHYHACARPVYFVQDSWYNEVYVPRYRDRHDHDHDGWDHGDWDHDRGGNGGKHKGGKHKHGKGHKN